MSNENTRLTSVADLRRTSIIKRVDPSSGGATQEVQSSSYSSSNVEFGPTPQRWMALAIATFFLIASGFNRACFGVVSDVFINYYRVSQTAIDWLTLSLSMISLVGSILLLAILPFRTVSFRLCCLIMSVSASLAYGLLFIGSLARNLYVFLLLGQLTLGVVNLFAYAFIPVVAVVWFPDYEMATAVGVSLGGVDLGNIIGFVMPSHMLEMPHTSDEAFWVMHVEENLRYMFTIYFVIALGFLFVIWVFIEEKPEYPPSRAEAIKDVAGGLNVLGKMSISKQRRFFRYLRLPVADLTFLMLVVSFAVVHTCYMIFTVLLSDIIRSFGADNGRILESKQVDLQAGDFMTAYSVGSLVGGIIGGSILDRTKRFRLISLTTSVLMTISAGLFIVALQMESFAGGIISYSVNGFFNGACYTALYEIITQHMYPVEELAMGCWIVFFVSVSGILLPLVARYIFTFASSLSVTLMQTGVQAVVIVIIVFLKPRYERYSINTSSDDSPTIPANTGSD